MILATRHGNRESRGLRGARADFTGTDRIPRPGQEGLAYSGRPVGLANAVGIPAVLRAIRLVSESIGGMPLQVVRDDTTGHQEPIRDAPQWPMLHDRPHDLPTGTAMAVWSFSVVCLIRGGLVLQKLKAGRELVGLEPIAPDRYGGKPVWEGNELRVKVRDRAGTKTLTLDDVVYIPGILLDDPHIGVGVIEAMRHALGNPLARQEFEGRYLANDGTPSVVLKHANDVEEPQRKAIRESFSDRHGGPSNAGRPALMWGGWELEKIGLSLEDAQFVESQRFTVQEAARMFGVPPGKLGDPDAPAQADPAQEDRDLLKYGLMPWMARLEQGLHADADVFPTKDLQPKFLADGLLRGDPDKRNAAYLKARQAGWMTANEIRDREGLPPHEDGDVLQATPVGGAPNDDTTPPAGKE